MVAADKKSCDMGNDKSEKADRTDNCSTDRSKKYSDYRYYYTGTGHIDTKRTCGLVFKG